MSHYAGPSASLARHAASPFFRAEIEETLAQAAFAPGMRVLDIGCGNGSLVREAVARGGRGVGCDVSREGLLAARGLTGLAVFVQGEALHLPVASGVVDRIFAQHVIEHLKNPRAALAEWRRVLRPGGRLVLVTPNALYPDPAIYEDPTHVRIFDPKALRMTVTEADFEVRRINTLFPFLSGHTVFGLRLRRWFARIPPWHSSGRSLVCVAERPRRPPSP